jgi:protein subunit release factor B
MGLRKLKVQVHLRAFIFSHEQKIRQQQHIKDKTHRRNAVWTNKVQKYVKEQTAPRRGLGGSYRQKEQEEYLKHDCAKTIVGGKLLGDNIIF